MGKDGALDERRKVMNKRKGQEVEVTNEGNEKEENRHRLIRTTSKDSNKHATSQMEHELRIDGDVRRQREGFWVSFAVRGVPNNSENRGYGGEREREGRGGGVLASKLNEMAIQISKNVHILSNILPQRL